VPSVGKRKLVWLMVTAACSFVLLIWLAGTVLSWPARQRVGAVPADSHGEAIEFASASGATLKGWLLAGEAGKGVVILMHGVRGNRLQTLDRARWLNRQGYSVLLFDFQAHGESGGQQITFGYLESRDAQAAVQYVRQRFPQAKLGVIGISLGGAAAVLAEPPLPIDALVLEMVYPDIHRAIANRMALHLGGWARKLAPLLEARLQPRLGVGIEALRPIAHVADLAVPKLFIVGEYDRHTLLNESQEFFEAARVPKDLWIVPGAQHEDLYQVAQTEYERRVLAMLNKHL
jgi:uncharacterized protein